MKKKKFIVCTEWVMVANVEVEAETLEEAKAQVWKMDGLPDDGEFLSGSFDVNDEFTEEANEATEVEEV